VQQLDIIKDFLFTNRRTSELS